MVRLRSRGQQGFTLAEVLGAVAILIILLMLLVPALMNLQRDLRQKELDAKAETIYVAAQNRLTAMRSSGYADQYQDTSKDSTLVKLPKDPIDRKVEFDESTNLPIVQPDLYAMNAKYRGTTGTVCSFVMTDGSTDGTLLNHNWVIEYEPDSGSVYAVYYSEDPEFNLEDYSVDTWSRYDSLRIRDNRLRDGARVGYYGGDLTASTSDTSTLQPTILVSNKEKLVVTLFCSNAIIDGVKADGDLEFTMALSDSFNHRYEKVYDFSSLAGDQTSTKSRVGSLGYMVTVTLDDLSKESLRFDALYGGTGGLVPGDVLNISLTVRNPSDLRVEQKTVRAVTNSLFADASNSGSKDRNNHNEEAVIEYGRHLQNLDMLTARTEGANTFAITKATLAKSISFDDTVAKDDWYNTYCKDGETKKEFFHGNDADGRAKFNPLSASTLKTFEGNNNKEGGGFSIAGLNVAESDNKPAGLFGTVNGGLAINNVTLTGTRVSGPADAGALAGTVEGSGSEINHCLVYLTANDRNGKDSDSVWVSGSRTGGLVGSVAAKQQLDDTVLKINNSFAATVINGSTVAGGLVGACDSSLQVNTSYADCYVHGGDGSKTAGLVGDVATTAAASVELADCYAAGFLYGASTYGLAGGSVKAATNVYTICASVDGAMQYSTASSIGTMSKVYFVHSGAAERGDVSGTNSMAGMGNAELLANLGGEGGQFTIDTTSSSHPYNLMGQALTTYAYPRLYANDHYGDWEAEFASGGLVYYEKYGENDYGFFGSNISTLNDGGIVVGDGYGIVYEVGDNLPDTVTVSMEGFDESYVIKPKSDSHYESSDGAGSRYWIYPLPREWMNVTPDDDSPSLWRVVVTEAAPGETTNAYYYNPHFAKTQQKEQSADAERPVLGVGGQIAVRSPRQLFSLSRYYDHYHDATVGLTFVQELDIAYTAYEWRGFYDPEVTGGIVAMQEPIGGGECSFDANYDGRCHWITGVCFEADSSDYVGMFGYNNGTLSNIVLRNEFGTDLQRFIHRMAVIGQNQHVYMGVLAGYNAESNETSGGIILNCAVSGYSMTGPLGMISAYSNSTLYVGGLVGSNAGIVQNSSSDCPGITVSAFNARAYVGGFVGRNEGTGSISDCYDLGHVEASYSRGGSVSLAGFAGYNEGDIRASYCATSLLASGESAHTHGFAPRGGAVSASRYLSNGTFEYLGLIRSYNFNSDTSGTATTRGVLCHQRGTSWATEGYAHDYAAGYVAHGDGYPYRAVVRDASDNWVHYGSWQDDVNMGGLGVFYWEHEEGGSNDGYHFTYLGVDGQEAIGGTTLCTAHDDGGLVTEYGYGYFAKSLLDSSQDSGSNTTPNVDFSMDNLGFTGGGEGQVNEAAKSDLERQMGGLYTFYPYATRSDSDPNASGRLYLSSGDPEVREGSFELTYDGKKYVFEVAPYFADAMSYEAGEISLVGTDGKQSNYAEKAGSAANEYEVRSLQQLQYINWNSETKNNSTFCRDSTYQKFPYLQYADSIVKGKQNEANVYAKRSRQCWRQTHDVGTDKSRVFKYTPIAASASASKNDSWEVVLYTWFGGDYEGGSYKIQNVDIASDSYTVGLFGVVVGANMHDIIMYSDTEKGSTITRVTTEDEGQVGTNPGAYSLGGLVGLAYDYNTTATTNVISNCAIAGYNIVDASSNKHIQGGGTVGGLFGVANVKLENCSAVTTVKIECTHDRGTARFGNYIRVGGLTGSAQYTVDNCYAGGEIKVNPRTVNELYDRNGQPVTDWAARASGNYTREQNVHIYVGGISGSAYTCNYFNFTGDTDSHDGQPVFSNCYSYVKLPNIEGTIKGVSYIAGPADRFGIDKAAITIINCRYLDTVNGGVTFTPTEYWFTKGAHSPGTDVEYRRQLLDDDSMRMAVLADFLNGDLKANKKLLYPDSGNAKRYPTADPNPKPISYDELKANRSAETGEVVFGSPWGAVKTEEGGVEVHGKYSFPGGNRPDLAGKDYPFPTVVTQDGDWVHYGAWPLNGASWSAGMATIDIFRDMCRNGSDAGRAQLTFVLRDPLHEVEGGVLEPKDISFSYPDIAKVVAIEAYDEDGDGTNDSYNVTIRALSEGATTVTATTRDSSPSFVLEVTADLEVTATPETLVGYSGGKSTLTLSANAVAYGSNTDRWDFEPPYTPTKIGDNTWEVEHVSSGYDVLNALYSYTYDNGEEGSTSRYHTYIVRANIPVKTFGVIGVSGDPDLTYSEKTGADAGTWEKGVAYNEVTRIQSTDEQIGKSRQYSSNAPALSDYSDADFFLYETVSDLENKGKALDGVNASVTVVSAEGLSGVELNPNDFDITLGEDKDLVEDDHFQYRPCKIRYIGTSKDEVGPVTLALSLTHEEDVVKSGGGSTPTRYSLSLRLDAPKYVATFDPAGGEGSVTTVKSSSAGKVTTPEAPVRVGYTFLGWQAEGSGRTVGPEEEIVLEEDTRFVAQWKANEYNVEFNPNGGSGSMERQQFTYDDDEKPLSKNTFEREGYVFDGWATEQGGKAVYEDEQPVKNLATEDGATVTLYAVWRDKMKLVLDANGGAPTASYLIDNSMSAVPDYALPSQWGYTLDGWYTASDGGSQVLTNEGAVALPSVPGYTGDDGTFDLHRDSAKLYAHWLPAEITLKGRGQVHTYKIPELANGTSNYKDQEKDEWQVGDYTYKLDGWYTLGSGNGGLKVIEADGTIVDGDEARAALVDGAEFHARWTQAPKHKWNPNKEPWRDKVKINFDAGDYLKVTMNVANCKVSKANVISFGNNNALTIWDDPRVVHVFYNNKDAGQMRANIGKRANGDKYFYPVFSDISNKKLVIEFRKEKLTVNGVEYLNGAYAAMVADEIAKSADPNSVVFGVGSVQGTGRSDAADYEIEICNDKKDDPDNPQDPPYEGYYLFD